MNDANDTDHVPGADMIDSLLDEAAHRPVPPMDAALMARIVADADRFMPAGPVAGGAVAATGWRDVLALLGGWPAVGGVVAAGVAGLWIGVAPPQLIDEAVSGLFGGTVAVDLTGLGDTFGVEG